MMLATSDRAVSLSALTNCRETWEQVVSVSRSRNWQLDTWRGNGITSWGRTERQTETSTCYSLTLRDSRLVNCHPCCSTVLRLELQQQQQQQSLADWLHGQYTLSQNKVPTFQLSVTMSNLNRFSTFLHCWKAYEICHKNTRHYPLHLRCVATLPWEIKNSNFLPIFSRCERKYKQITYLSPLTLLFIPKFWYFRRLQ